MGAHWGGNKLAFPQTNDPKMGGYTRKVTITSPDAVDLATAITLVNEIKAKVNAAGHYVAAVATSTSDKPRRP